MDLLLDMVHHNPGERPFDTEFSKPAKLAEYGYNGQVFKHINTVISFSGLGSTIFPQGSEEWKWLVKESNRISREIIKAKEQGLKVFYHIDLFVLPRKLVEQYGDEICIENGKISIDQPKTLEIHRIMLEELFSRFPAVDGLIIRVGETYLYDTPYHVGNGPIRSSEYSGSEVTPEKEIERYVKLISFLRDEVCIKHGRYLIFRTWDCYPDKFHADLDYYLNVTDRIEPNEKLIFSIKHTALDFWRRVRFNPCIAKGRHPQVIEIQCQREYEGKGAYPNYIMDGIINGFEENNEKTGLKDVMAHPLIKGFYTWSRGGGWFGPRITNELWCDLNVFVISAYARHPQLTEEELFYIYAQDHLKLQKSEAEVFRKICLLSAKAVLKGRYCEAYDTHLHEKRMPSENWMRDDQLGGVEQLQPILDYLYSNNLFKEALSEKNEAMSLWMEIVKISEIFAGRENLAYIYTSSLYGLSLYSIIRWGWEILIEGYKGDKTSVYNTERLRSLLSEYDHCWEDFRQIQKHKDCASLYTGEYMDKPGLDYFINLYRPKA